MIITLVLFYFIGVALILSDPERHQLLILCLFTAFAVLVAGQIVRAGA